MQSLFRFATIITVIFAVGGPARAQEIAPPGSGVSIQKMVVDNGMADTVKYFVKGGSPRVQALVRRMEWAENELSVVEQLQRLKLDTVVNERRVAAFRTAQLTDPSYPPGFVPYPVAVDDGRYGQSRLQRTLEEQLADEATPEAAMQLIGLLEQMQTRLDAELKALPPKEQEEVQGPIDALRRRVAGLPRADAPPPRPQPVADRRVSGFSPISQQQQAKDGSYSVRHNSYGESRGGPGGPAEVLWGGRWWGAQVVKEGNGKYYIHYDGYGDNWDEWVGPDRIRFAAQARPDGGT